MSKRAEERALEAYPDTYVKYRKVGDPEGIQSGVSPFPNTHILERKCYMEGYEQAEKDLCWHSVDESLPPMDEEVIVLLGEWNEVRIEPLYRIAFGHVVNKEYCEDFSGWNIPGVRYWMPMPEIPKEEKKWGTLRR